MRHLPLVLSPLMLAALPAIAQDRDNTRYVGDQGSHWTFEAGAGTDNRSKGTSKSGNAPYVFAEAQWNAANGFYADIEFETIDSSGSNVETEAEAGWQFSGGGFDFDVSTSHKWRVEADPGQDAAAWEFQADVMRDFGALDTRLRVEHSPDGLGSTEAWTWVEGRLRWPVAERITAGVTLGRREQDRAPDYTGWNAGLTWEVREGVDADLRWHDTDAHQEGETYEGALVAALTLTF